MFKKSSELRKIEDLKGNHVGYIRCRNGVTTVIWLDGIQVVSMSFTGPASVIFGKIIIECDGRRVIAPKTIAQPMKSTKKELGAYVDALFRKNIAPDCHVSRFELSCIRGTNDNKQQTMRGTIDKRVTSR